MQAMGRRGMLSGGLAATLAMDGCRSVTSRLRMATNLPPDHPLNTRLAQALDRVRARTAGRLDIQLFVSSQLGSDADQLSQLRAGAIQFQALSGTILSTLVPVSAISGMAFAFQTSAQVFAALDGELGGVIRAGIAARGLTAFPKIFDNGFRQITTSARPIQIPSDLHAMKIRVPLSQLWISTFQALGAAPTSINFNEVYSALQTKVVEGQENPLSTINSGKLYEVQRYCSMTRHMWDGFWVLANPAAMAALPVDQQQVLTEEIDKAALDQRADIAALDAKLPAKLAGQGMVFNTPDPAPFRAALKTNGFYTHWKRQMGDEAWAVLEQAAGRLT